MIWFLMQINHFNDNDNGAMVILICQNMMIWFLITVKDIEGRLRSVNWSASPSLALRLIMTMIMMIAKMMMMRTMLLMMMMMMMMTLMGKMIVMMLSSC